MTDEQRDELLLSLAKGLNNLQCSFNDFRVEIKTELNTKIDSVEQKLNAKIDSVEQKLNDKIDNVHISFNQKLEEVAKNSREETIIRELLKCLKIFGKVIKFLTKDLINMILK